MKNITMHIHVSGTRGDGKPWPKRGGTVDVPDPEAAELVAQGYATENAAQAPAGKPSSRPTGEVAATSPKGEKR